MTEFTATARSRNAPPACEPRDGPDRCVSLHPSRPNRHWGRSYDHDEERASLWWAKEDAEGQGEDRASPVAHGLGARACDGAGAEPQGLPTYGGAEPPRQVAGVIGVIGGCQRGRNSNYWHADHGSR